MKLMSLFDGSGGFPLAASLCGIEPVYAAEVEPYPIAVTKNRFPKMKHLGDVSKVKGGEIEPVDIITFGSPCQDMSIAGKRAGLKHADMGDDETTRSGLFLEAIRIIKEMREATNGVYPRYAIWENVPGAFSSNRGEDFRTVLEEFIRVKEKDAVMPDVPKAGWPYADCYSGNGWSLAYRVFDAQYWGVPQRRRRIYLVADQDPSKNQGGIAVIEKYVYDTRGNGDGETVPTITGDHNNRVTDYTCLAITRCYDIGEARLRTPSEYIEKSPTITARCGTGGNNVPGVVYCLQGNGIDRADTAGCNGKGWKEDTSYTLNTIDKPAVGCAQKSYTEFKDESTLSTLKATGGSYGGGSENIVVKNYIVRRLTPTECARLQGFPDLWGYLDKKESFTDEEYKFWLEVRNTYARINNKAVKDYTKAQMLSWYNKLHSDSAEYKMWGNGIALPNALYVMQGIAEVVGVHHSK